MSHPRTQFSVNELLQTIRRDSPLGISDLFELRKAFSSFYGSFASPDTPRPHLLSNTPAPIWEITAIEADPSYTILFFHGGGFTIGSTEDHADLCGRLSSASHARVLSLDYRLAPEHPFPAAVEDAARTYTWLLDTVGDPSRVSLAGISAGGTLVLTTLLNARDAGQPLPSAAVCMSPAPDLSFPGNTITSNLSTDWITPTRLSALRAAYLGEHPHDEPMASPIYGDFTGLSPLMIQVGGGELLLDNIRTLVTKIEAEGVDTHFVEWPKLFHCWQVFAGVLQEGRNAITQAGSYLRKYMKLG